MILTGFEAASYAIANDLALAFDNDDSDCHADRIGSLNPSQIEDAFIFVPSHAEIVGHNLNLACSLKAAGAELTHKNVVEACLEDEYLGSFMIDIRLASDDCFTHGDTISMRDGTVLVYRTAPKALWYTMALQGFVVAKDPSRTTMVVHGEMSG